MEGFLSSFLSQKEPRPPLPSGFLWPGSGVRDLGEGGRRGSIRLLLPRLPSSKVASSNCGHSSELLSCLPLQAPGSPSPCPRHTRGGECSLGEQQGFCERNTSFLNHLRMILIWVCLLFLVGAWTHTELHEWFYPLLFTLLYVWNLPACPSVSSDHILLPPASGARGGACSLLALSHWGWQCPDKHPGRCVHPVTPSG